MTIVNALIALVAGYLVSGLLAAGYVVTKAYRTSESVLRDQAPTMAGQADEKGVTMRQLAVRYLAPVALVGWPLVLLVLLTGDRK